VPGEALLRAAVANNASWCDAVCRSHGHPGVFTARLWISARHALTLYPNAITLSPDVTAPQTQAGQDPSRPYAVKDSFARLDLTSEGLEPVFDAEWIARLPAPAGSLEDDLSWDTVTDVRELAQWESAWAGGDGAGGRLFRRELLARPVLLHPGLPPGRRPGRRDHRLHRRPGDRDIQRVQHRPAD
jgi:hypothetical protein